MSDNRLRHETSPYLLQHQENPVHWWAWGPEALAEAKATGKPILLSVGYAACHWCHVMAHESFEDEATADVMNELFVNIKVDREERPDIDAIYMGALHRLGQHGGWPLTMFLDGDARPFWGGTYFPKVPTYGRPAFIDVLKRVAEIYRTEQDKVRTNAEALVTALKEEPSPRVKDLDINDHLLSDLTRGLARAVDPIHGGITGAPKFPQWSFFWMLWRGGIRYANREAQTLVAKTLEQICQGGIYDHLGGGFSRYSVDELWLVPHFEKMLYDNALMIDLMTEVYRETRAPLLKRRIEETVTWLEREMIAEGGAFAASLDADSEGEEGKFYVWSAEEIARVLGPTDAALFGKTYGVTVDGNFEGHTILNRLGSVTLGSDEAEAHLATLRQKLLDARASRIRPGFDDKVLADWNGLMIAALAKAGRVFDWSPWVTLAKTAFTFVAEKMTVDGKLVHAYRCGRGSAPATAGDYANMIAAALLLFEAEGDASLIARARHWQEILDRDYWVDGIGGYATTALQTTDVIVRLRAATDDATPNANAIALANLEALAIITGETRYHARAEALLKSFSASVARNPGAHTGLLAAAIDTITPTLIVVSGDGEDALRLRKALCERAMPGAIELTIGNAEALPNIEALIGKSARDGSAQAFICSGPQCSAPVTSPEALKKQLEAARVQT